MPKNKIDQEQLEKELAQENPEVAPEHQMGEKLRKLLEVDIEDHKKKSKGRLGEMIAIFAKHNYYAGGLTPLELRTTLEDLGPTYVKIGQIMSSRPDILPNAYCKELEKLRQNVKPLDAEIARAVIEDETGKSIDEIFKEFKDKPLGSASIGQAHYGVLKDGTKVVTKVQRPLIEDMMMRDYKLLKKLAKLVNKFSNKDKDDQVIDLYSVVEELEKVSIEELDFRVEANNTKFFKEKCIEDPNVVTCPTVIDELTTKRIFTMTFVDGCSLGAKDKLLEQGCDLNQIGAALVNNFVHQILDVGTFHADPHQGNIMVANKLPYWIDFGMVGHISKKEIDQIQNIVLAIISQDTDQLVNVIMSMGATSSKTNRDKLAEDVTLFLSRFNGASSVADMDMSAMLTDVMDLAGKHHITLPGTYTLLARAVLAIEGVIEQLCPELNLIELISNKLMDRLKKNFDIKQTLLGAGKDILGTGKKTLEIPGLTAEALTTFTKGRTKINTEITGIDEQLENGGVLVKNVCLVLIACVLFIGGCILGGYNIEPITPTGLPLLSVVLLTFSAALAIYAIRQLAKKSKESKKKKKK